MNTNDISMRSTSRVMSDTNYFASCLLRDYYGMNLLQYKKIIDLRNSRNSSHVSVQRSSFEPEQLCQHLAPIFQQLKSEYDIVEIARRNGSGWGFVSFINELPKSFPQNFGLLPDCVTISLEQGMVSCSECWSNIAEHDRYATNWADTRQITMCCT